MARLAILTESALLEWLRTLVVCGCALALIAAGESLPV